MKYAADLHIHSALSPCADNDMTPNNIVNMAYIKGLDFIAVTDHNSAGNAKAILGCAAERGIIVLPGLELETSEEVHLICLFPDIGGVLSMQDRVYKALPPIKNREDIYGKQLFLDMEDRITGSEDGLLLTAAEIGVYEAFSMVIDAGGAVIPAHVDRQSYSLLSNLGSIPGDLGIKYLEISKACDISDFMFRNPWAVDYEFIKSSDAHCLGDILERETFLDLKERSAQCLIEKLRG